MSGGKGSSSKPVVKQAVVLSPRKAVPAETPTVVESMPAAAHNPTWPRLHAFLELISYRALINAPFACVSGGYRSRRRRRIQLLVAPPPAPAAPADRPSLFESINPSDAFLRDQFLFVETLAVFAK
ncbi:unnamed protein product [Heligmosomoides polygyrus]|uniref:Uncharacterized protein n=1 Tax=Heligmosomoides polygyrus TaxID=6339 RepID=A0A183FFB8_HELPZ|nr:unnamed protein product [Heligmosomoides polygyrus]